MDTWFSWVNTNYLRGTASFVRYADDGVFTFRSLIDAEKFLLALRKRLEKYGIRLHEGKTKVIPSGAKEATRRAGRGDDMPSFTFLGFVHAWGRSWNRKLGFEFWRIRRRTCPVRFRKKLLSIKEFIRSHKHDGNLVERVKRILRGYPNNFAINDNSKRVSQFIDAVRAMLFEYLNKRSQRRSLNWQQFKKLMTRLGYPDYLALRNLFFNSKFSGIRPGKC